MEISARRVNALKATNLESGDGERFYTLHIYTIVGRKGLWRRKRRKGRTGTNCPIDRRVELCDEGLVELAAWPEGNAMILALMKNAPEVPETGHVESEVLDGRFALESQQTPGEEAPPDPVLDKPPREPEPRQPEVPDSSYKKTYLGRE